MKHQFIFGLGLLVFAFGFGLMVGHVALSWAVCVLGSAISIVASVASIVSYRRTPAKKPESVPFIVNGRELTQLRVVDTTIQDEEDR